MFNDYRVLVLMETQVPERRTNVDFDIYKSGDGDVVTTRVGTRKREAERQ